MAGGSKRAGENETIDGRTEKKRNGALQRDLVPKVGKGNRVGTGMGGGLKSLVVG